MKLPILLDTCAIIWIMEDRLSAKAAAVMANAAMAGLSTFVSPISALELGRLFAEGRLRSPVSPQEYLRRLLVLPGLHVAEMPPKLLLGSAFLPGPIPKDPADRIIAATAREYGFVVMTRDTALLDYAAQGYLAAVEC